MKVALYSRRRGEEDLQFIHTVIEHLKTLGVEIVLHCNCRTADDSCNAFFDSYVSLQQSLPVDFLISFGGDGSFIDAVNLVGDLNIPLVGINTGRIGFLAGIKKDNYKECFQMLLQKQYTIEKRSLLHMESSVPHMLPGNFVVNDLTVRATDSDSIIAVNVWAGDQKVNTYWGDGLIIATPTGSTAYSMSCGGPILHPLTQVHVLTPIAAHSLNVRPLVIPADIPLTIEVQGRSGKYSLQTDTEKFVMNENVKLFLRKENFCTNTVLFENSNFYDIIREKLLWGIDKRNA